MEVKEFKKVENITEYVKDKIKTRTLILYEAVKVAKVQARRGIIGEKIVTKMANGLEETKNIVRIDEEKGKPGWIVTSLLIFIEVLI